MRFKTPLIIVSICIVVVAFVIGYFLIGQSLRPHVSTDNSTNNNQELINTLHQSYLSYRKSIIDRDIETFNKVVAPENASAVKSMIDGGKKIENTAISFIEIAPELGTITPETGKITPDRLEIKTDKSEATLYYKSNDPAFLNGYVIFENDHNIWKYAAERWFAKTNELQTVTIQQNAKIIEFNATTGFTPKTLQVASGSTVAFKNITGIVRTYGNNNPENFASPFEINGNYQISTLPIGKYQYALLYRGAAPYPFWPDSIKIFTGELTITQ